jgi:hypothetical protein
MSDLSAGEALGVQGVRGPNLGSCRALMAGLTGLEGASFSPRPVFEHAYTVQRSVWRRRVGPVSRATLVLVRAAPATRT